MDQKLKYMVIIASIIIGAFMFLGIFILVYSFTIGRLGGLFLGFLLISTFIFIFIVVGPLTIIFSRRLGEKSEFVELFKSLPKYIKNLAIFTILSAFTAATALYINYMSWVFFESENLTRVLNIIEAIGTIFGIIGTVIVIIAERVDRRL